MASLLMEEYDDSDALQVACWSSIFLLIILEKETALRKKPIGNVASTSPQDGTADSAPDFATNKREPSLDESDSPEPSGSRRSRQRFAPRRKNPDSAKIKRTRQDISAKKKPINSTVWEIPSSSSERKGNPDHPHIHFHNRSTN
ncbi:MAG: hypothetical protein GX825_03465 [Syntrophomonadaceae bacterium]|nr:hypothetical protein [Syntrophomonadaceae bacterium]